MNVILSIPAKERKLSKPRTGFHVEVDSETYRWLHDFAESRGYRTRSELMREIIRQLKTGDKKS